MKCRPRKIATKICSFPPSPLSKSIGLIAIIAVSTTAHAIDLYVTSIEGSQIDKVNTVTNAVSTVFITPSASDSLIFDGTGRIIYTNLNTGEVRRYNPSDATD